MKHFITKFDKEEWNGEWGFVPCVYNAVFF